MARRWPRRHNRPRMTAPSELTLTELGERWPDAAVFWDRDVASQGWTPLFSGQRLPLLAHLEVLAFDRSCLHATGTLEWEALDWSTCRCVVWTGEAWITLHDARYHAVRSALHGARFPFDDRGAQMLWFMLMNNGCAAEITPSSFIVPYIISGRSDHYELSLAPSILSFLLGGNGLPETGHVIRRIQCAAAPFDGSFERFPVWDELRFGERYVRVDDANERTVFRIRASKAALDELDPGVPVVDPVRFLELRRTCPHCGRIPERYRVLRDGSHVCLACGRSMPPRA